jgi:alpha-tubulin suppressor-like RCC1 family protein
MHYGVSLESVDVGGSYACAVDSRDQVQCLGNNYYGNFGLGTQEANSGSAGAPSVKPAAPPRRSPGVAFATLETGEGYTCGIDTAGRARCWGYNFWGQLGNGTTTNTATPTYVRVKP